MINIARAYKRDSNIQAAARIYIEADPKNENKEILRFPLLEWEREQTRSRISQNGFHSFQHKRCKSEHRLTVPELCLRQADSPSKNGILRGGLELQYHEKEPPFSPKMLSMEEQLAYIVDAMLDGNKISNSDTKI